MTISGIIPIANKIDTPAEEMIDRDVSPLTEYTHQLVEKGALAQEIRDVHKTIEEEPKQSITTVDEKTVVVEQQPTNSVETTFNIHDKRATKSIKETTKRMKHETDVADQGPMRTELFGEKNEKEVIVSKRSSMSSEEEANFLEILTIQQTIVNEEIALTNYTPTIEETDVTVEGNVQSNESLAMEKTRESSGETGIVGEIFTAQENIKEKSKSSTAIIQEKIVIVEQQVVHPSKSAPFDEDDSENTRRWKRIENIFETIDNEITIQDNKEIITEATKQTNKNEKMVSDVLSTMPQEQIESLEELTFEETTTEEEMNIIQTLPTVNETDTTTDRVDQKDISYIIEKVEASEKRTTIEKARIKKEIIEEKSKLWTETTEEKILHESKPILSNEGDTKYSLRRKSVENIILTVEGKICIEQEKSAMVGASEKAFEKENIVDTVQNTVLEQETKLLEDQSNFIEKLTPDQNIKKEVVAMSRITQTLDEDESTKDDIDRKYVTHIREEIELPIEKTAIIEETVSREEILEEKSMPQIENVDERRATVNEKATPESVTTPFSEKDAETTLQEKPVEEISENVEGEKPMEIKPAQELLGREEVLFEERAEMREKDMISAVELSDSVEESILKKTVTTEEETTGIEVESIAKEANGTSEMTLKRTAMGDIQPNWTDETAEEHKTPITNLQRAIAASIEDAAITTEEMKPEVVLPIAEQTKKTLGMIPVAGKSVGNTTKVQSSDIEKVAREKLPLNDEGDTLIEKGSSTKDITAAKQVDERRKPKAESSASRENCRTH